MVVKQFEQSIPSIELVKEYGKSYSYWGTNQDLVQTVHETIEVKSSQADLTQFLLFNKVFHQPVRIREITVAMQNSFYLGFGFIVDNRQQSVGSMYSFGRLGSDSQSSLYVFPTQILHYVYPNATPSYTTAESYSAFFQKLSVYGQVGNSIDQTETWMNVDAPAYINVAFVGFLQAPLPADSYIDISMSYEAIP